MWVCRYGTRLASEFWFTKKTKLKTHEKKRVLRVGDLFPL